MKSSCQSKKGKKVLSNGKKLDSNKAVFNSQHIT